jgi:serine protease Do
MPRTPALPPLVLLLLLASSAPSLPQDRDTKVRNDKREVMEDGYWIYNDLPAGIEQAKVLGRPLMVVFRCIP